MKLQSHVVAADKYGAGNIVGQAAGALGLGGGSQGGGHGGGGQHGGDMEHFSFFPHHKFHFV